MVVMGRRQVASPTVRPLPYGLLAAATVVDDADVHLQAGVEYETLNCGSAHLTAAECFTGAPAGALVDDDGMPWTEGDGFMVYALHTCRVPAGGYADAERAARAKLAAGEGRAIEERFGLSVLADPAGSDLTPTPGTALPLLDAVAMVEEWAGVNYSGPPVLHVARSTGTMLTNRAGAGVAPVSGRLETVQGSVVASGPGYLAASRAAISGVTPDAGERWLFVTGAVQVYRGQAQVTDPVVGLASPRNEVGIIAQRPVAVTAECLRARILVQSPRAVAGL